MLFSYRGSTQLTICVTYNRYDYILHRTGCCREGYVTPDGIFCWSRCFNHWEVSFLDCVVLSWFVRWVPVICSFFPLQIGIIH